MYFRMVVSEQYLKLEYTEAILSCHTIGFATSSNGFVYLVAFVIFKLYCSLTTILKFTVG